MFIFAGFIFSMVDLGARIIGASRWELGDKNVLVYHDSHDEKDVPEISERDFAYLRGHALSIARPKLPCTLIVENYCCGPHSELMKEFDRDAHASYRFLSKFNDLIGRILPNGVSVKSVEVRTPLCLLGAWVREAMARARGMGPTGLNGELHLKILGGLRDISVTSLIADTDRSFRELQVKNRGNGILTAIIAQLKGAFDKNRIALLETLSECGLAARFGTPLVCCALQDIAKGDFDHYVDLLCSSMFACGFLVPLMEARLISEIVNTPGTVVVFAGLSHCANIEKMLRDLRFEHKRAVNPELLQQIEETTRGMQFDVEAMHKLLSEAHLDDPTVFDWII